MKDLSKEECKDASPAATIARISAILGGLGIKLTEENLKSTSNTFTTKLYFKGTAIGSQGKGVSRALSRASAYGEFIERLQNMILGAPFHYSPEVLALGPYKLAPDERRLGASDLQLLSRNFGKVYFPGTPGGGGRTAAAGLERWLAAFPGTDRKAFTGLPFCSLLDGRLHYLPWQMLALYRSNGMCAGNTPEEAMVQGLCEILERHVNKVAIETPVTPPDVPPGIVKRYRRPAAIIREIEASGQYRVVVKDFSLGKGFPVLGVILISLERQSYMVNFGSHPSFGIALERCLTEALQSYKVDSRFGQSLLPFSFLPRPSEEPHNFINSVRIGRGHFPGALFLEKPSYPFRPWADSGLGNGGMLRGLLSFVKALGFDVLARDKSFLGFPAFQLLVPGLSEVEEPPQLFLPAAVLRAEVGDIMLDIPSAGADKIDKLLAHVAARLPYMMECQSPTGFLNFPVRGGAPPDATPIPLFLAKLCLKKGDPARAHAVVCAMINRQGPAATASLKCARDLLGAVKSGFPAAEAAGALRSVYGAAVVRKVLAEWRRTERTFQVFPKLPCMDCGRCTLRRHCLRKDFLDLYRRLKSALAAANIDQAGLRRFSLS